MKYREIELQSEKSSTAATEIMFTVASERADGAELIRFNIKKGREQKNYTRLFAGVVRVLKSMKSRGAIQFFATPEVFKQFGMEAKFLVNKFPTLFENLPEEDEESGFVYIKI